MSETLDSSSVSVSVRFQFYNCNATPNSIPPRSRESPRRMTRGLRAKRACPRVYIKLYVKMPRNQILKIGLEMPYFEFQNQIINTIQTSP